MLKVECAPTCLNVVSQFHSWVTGRFKLAKGWGVWHVLIYVLTNGPHGDVHAVPMKTLDESESTPAMVFSLPSTIFGKHCQHVNPAFRMDTRQCHSPLWGLQNYDVPCIPGQLDSSDSKKGARVQTPKSAYSFKINCFGCGSKMQALILRPFARREN